MCPGVLQDLEVSLGPWGAVRAQPQGQEQGSHLRAPGIQSCQGASQVCLLFKADKPRAKGDNGAGLSPARAQSHRTQAGGADALMVTRANSPDCQTSPR